MESNNDKKHTHNKQEFKDAGQGDDLNEQPLSKTTDKIVTSHRFPQFIRLFVLRRILAQCIDNINDGTLRDFIEGTDCDNVIKQQMETSMEQLFDEGLCKYMKMYYDFDKDFQEPRLIDLI